MEKAKRDMLTLLLNELMNDAPCSRCGYCTGHQCCDFGEGGNYGEICTIDAIIDVLSSQDYTEKYGPKTDKEHEETKKRDEICFSGGFEGDGAYGKFKELASAFYEDGTWHFVGLSLDEEPTDNNVKFHVQFWKSKDGGT